MNAFHRTVHLQYTGHYIILHVHVYVTVCVHVNCAVGVYIVPSLFHTCTCICMRILLLLLYLYGCALIGDLDNNSYSTLCIMVYMCSFICMYKICTWYCYEDWLIMFCNYKIGYLANWNTLHVGCQGIHICTFHY